MTDHDHDWRRQLESPGYLDDLGFTDRVMDALPPRRRGLSQAQRAVVLMGCALLAGLLGLFALPGGSLIARAFRDLMGGLTGAGLGRHGLAGPITGMVLVLVVAGGAVAAARRAGR
jgi:hypothetical protein